MNQRFPKSEKLKKRSAIKALFDTGDSITFYPLRLVYLPTDETSHKVGVSVPKRRFKRAVDRNRIKRQIREAYRLNKKEEVSDSSHYAMLFIYLSKEKKNYAEIQRAMVELLRKIAKL